MKLKIGKAVASLVLGMASVGASAAQIYWTDWTTASGQNGFTGFGTITTPTSTVSVTYNNPRGVGFFQASGGTNYWASPSFSSTINNAASPYTSTAVDNIPTGTDIIGLQFAGLQSLHFSEAIANPVFSYVSLNGNGYSFNRDFDILSYGDGSLAHPYCGFWGCGDSYKNVIDHGGGNIEYQLLSHGGEPHGTLQFKGAFQDVSWNSLSNEYWNGFTVGVQGTAVEVFATPEPGSLALLGLALASLAIARRRKASRS